MEHSILIVDDNDAFLEFVVMLLRRHGHRPRPHRSARDGLASLRAQPASLVISDLFMPDMDGIELVRRVKTEFPGLPVIGFSGASFGFTEACLRSLTALGAISVFRKPLDEVALLAHIDAIIGPR